MKMEILIKNKKAVLIFCSITFLWLLFSFAWGQYEAQSDGFTEIGVPFIFYRYTDGKCFDCTGMGVLYFGLLKDLLLIICFSTCIFWGIKFIKRKNVSY